MEDDLKELHVTHNPTTAQMIKNTLEDNGINVILTQSVSPSAFPFTVNGMAKVKIMIREDDIDKARRMLQESFDGILDEE